MRVRLKVFLQGQTRALEVGLGLLQQSLVHLVRPGLGWNRGPTVVADVVVRVYLLPEVC